MRDVQQDQPVAYCCRCGVELYRWDPLIEIAEGPVCEDCEKELEMEEDVD